MILNNLFKKPRFLGVLLCYNDGDILKDVISNLIENNHAIIAWDHGSTDNTKEVLDEFKSELIERKLIPREFDFYKIYPAMSENIIKNYSKKYDWISWPDDDEILEGPRRDKTYLEYLQEVYKSKYNFIQFNNNNFWFTENDDSSIISPVKRIKYYSLFPDCAPRIRSWRASVTNIREFNHNILPGEKFPENFNLRHYPMRSEKQALKRIKLDRANIQRLGQNYHYKKIDSRLELMKINSSKLYLDNGGELKKKAIFSWREIYGNS